MQMYVSISDPGTVTYHPMVWRKLAVVPRGNSRRALALCAPANQQSVSGVGVSTPCGAVSTRGMSVFVPGNVGFVDVWKEL